MIEKLLEQRIKELEFRLQTVERAALMLAKRVSELDVLYHRATIRPLSELFEEEERKQ